MRSLNAEKEEEEGQIQNEGHKESSPRGVLEDGSISLESETLAKDSNSNGSESETASKPSTSGSETQLNSSGTAQWRDFFRGLKGATRRIQTFPPPKKRGPKLTRSKTQRIREELIPVVSSPLETDIYCLKSSWKNFSLSEIKTATNNFNNGLYLFQNLYLNSAAF